MTRTAAAFAILLASASAWSAEFQQLDPQECIDMHTRLEAHGFEVGHRQQLDGRAVRLYAFTCTDGYRPAAWLIDERRGWSIGKITLDRLTPQ